MDEKTLKRLSRKDLLEILVLQSKKMDEMKAELEEKERLLEDKRIMISETGSIAEASLKINNVFTSCEEAAKQYLDNLKSLCEEQEKLNSELKAKLEKTQVKEKKPTAKTKSKTTKKKKKK